MLVHLPVDHTAESVRNGLIETMGKLPSHLRGSLAWDQGAEMAKHKSLQHRHRHGRLLLRPRQPLATRIQREHERAAAPILPEGTDLNAYGLEDLEHVARNSNARPRKTLDWDTPAERLRDLLITS